MDTSTAWQEIWQMHRRLQDREKIASTSIPAETWLMTFDDLSELNDRALERAPGVFKPLADYMSGKESRTDKMQIPRRMTKFEEGLSPNTRVLLIQMAASHSGKRLTEGTPGLWSENTKQYLLLLTRKENHSRSCSWAHWEMGYHLEIMQRPGEHSYVRTVKYSRVRFLSKEAVSGIFREQHNLPVSLLDSMHVDLHRAQSDLKQVSALFTVVEQMKFRVDLK